MKTKRFLALLLTLVMLLGMLPTMAFTVSANEGEGEAEEYPKDAEYDFTVPGSTISFLDKDGVLLTEESGWSEGENVVTTWYVFMYRATKGNLRLGYSPEGELFLPHKVYEGDTADLLYVKDNNMFRVSATKDAVQTFNGSEILKTVSLTATNGTVTLASAPVYAETPFGFAYMGTTDENGAFSLNSTNGAFKLWISSNAGYILNKSVTVTDSTTEISFADEITNAVEIDVAARKETYEKALGYVVAIGKPGESEELNMLTTSYLNPETTAFVTPGTYRVACAIWLEDHNSYYSSDTSGGLWVDLAQSASITQKTTYDFAIADFEGRYAIRDSYKMDAYGENDLMAYKVYAEHADGYVIPGRADFVDYLRGSVTVTVGETQYPYTFCRNDFSMLYDANVYKKGDESTVIQTWEGTDWEFSLSSDFFGETENEYVVKYFPKWDSMSFPSLFPDGEWYSTTFKTKAYNSGSATYKKFESSEYFHSVYYIDENGDQAIASYSYDNSKYYYSVPESVKNGDYLFGVYVGYDALEYGIIPVSDALFSDGYQHTPHTDFSEINFEVKSGDATVDCSVTFGIILKAGKQQFILDGLEMGARIPCGEYVISAKASYEVCDDETGLVSNTALISYLEEKTVSAESHTFTIDYSTFKSFTIDASAFYTEDYWAMDDYKKQIAFHYADGSVVYVNWGAAPITLYCATLPEYATGEMYYYALEEMTPFSPYVSLDPIEIEDGKTYKFDFKPTAIEITGSTTFESSENTVLTYKVTDGFGNVLNDMWNLLNEWAVHSPLKSKEYPFRDENGNPVNHQYTVDVYLRAKGETRYEKLSFTDFTKADLGMLDIGEYEGYVEINFDTYLDEYLVEYPMEKGVLLDEYWGEYISVYDNVSRVLHGVLRDEFAFTVIEQTHKCDFSDWEDDGNGRTHTRVCKDSECEKFQTKPHEWDEGLSSGEPSCTEGAEITYTCKDCGATKVDSASKLGHDWNDWTDDGVDSPTDTHSRTCKRNCGVETETEAHKWSDWAPDGENNHKKTCSVCDGVRTEKHNWDDGVVDAATCTKGGTITYTCSGCGATKTENKDKLGHDWTDWTDTGSNAVADVHTRSCKRDGCGETESESHKWSDWTSTGSTNHKKICSVCNGERTNIHAFDEGEVIKEATTTEVGARKHTCADCKATKTEIIPKIVCDHSWSKWTADNDETHTHVCVNGGGCKAFQRQEHEWDEGKVTTNPTETTEGVKTYYCLDCGHEKTESVPMLEHTHSFGRWTSDGADTHSRRCDNGETCTAIETAAHECDLWSDNKDGTHSGRCTVCYGELTEAHKWSDWSVGVVEGQYIRSCICGAVEELTVKAEIGDVVVNDTNSEENGANADLVVEDPLDLFNSVLTNEEQNAVSNGATVSVYLEVQDIPADDVSASAKAAAEEEIKDGDNKLNENTELGMYLDINLFKEVTTTDGGASNTEATQITETSGKVKITIQIPADLISTDRRVNRVYRIIRVHEDENGNLITDVIEGIFDPENKTFTFETDKFSTYALVYNDDEAKVGDANGDGVVDTKDAVLLSQYLAGWVVEINLKAADCNGDGEVSTVDAVLFAQYLAGWDVKLGPTPGKGDVEIPGDDLVET